MAHAPHTAQRPRKVSALVALATASALLLGACDFDKSDEELTPTAAPTASDGTSEAGPYAEFYPGEHLNNPYAGAAMYVNATWSERVLETADNTGDDALADDMRALAETPTGVWMDRISAIEGNTDGPGLRHHLDAALEQAEEAGAPVAITVVIYNLPGRDCFALASNGELPATDEGLARYQGDYVDVIAEMFAEEKYQDLRIVTVIEPDSLPNLVTNASDPNCQASDPYYRQGVAYSLDAFAPMPHVYSYIDAAHSGWLGWDNNAGPTAQLFADVVRSTSAGFDSVDGFITNTANYTPLEEPYLTNPEHQVGGQAVKSGAFYEFNAQFDEADWTADLYRRLVGAGFPDSIGMLIDTSRNGWGGDARPTAAGTSASLDSYVDESKVDRRGHRGAWCNQDGAGIGRLPQALPAGFPDSHLDAFVWVKPPGESDGSSREIDNDEGKGFDRMCDPTFTTDRLAGQATHALADAPVSGKWFEAQFTQLVANAYPAVGAEVPAPRDEPTAFEPAGGESGARQGTETEEPSEPAPSESSPSDGAPSGTATASPAPDGDNAAPAPGTPAGGCAAVLVISNEWEGGFQADVTVTAGEAIAGWQVQLALPSGTTTDGMWNGDASGTSGTITVTNVDWNGALSRGDTGGFGFTATGAAPAAGAVPCISS